MSKKIEEKLESNYDMFRINIKDSYRVCIIIKQNLDKKFRIKLKKVYADKKEIKRKI